jgi:hypothetical protein
MNRNQKKFRSLRAPHLILASSYAAMHMVSAYGQASFQHQVSSKSRRTTDCRTAEGRPLRLFSVTRENSLGANESPDVQQWKCGLGSSREDRRLGNTSYLKSNKKQSSLIPPSKPALTAIPYKYNVIKGNAQ